MNDEAIIAEPEIYITRLVPSTDDISGNSRDRSSFGSHVSEHIFRSVYSYTDLRLGMYLSFVEGDGRGTITDRTIALHFLFFQSKTLRSYRNLFTIGTFEKIVRENICYFCSLKRFWKYLLNLNVLKESKCSFSNSGRTSIGSNLIRCGSKRAPSVVLSTDSILSIFDRLSNVYRKYYRRIIKFILLPAVYGACFSKEMERV